VSKTVSARTRNTKAGRKSRVPDRAERAAIRLGQLEDAVGFNLRLAQEASFRAFAQRVADPLLKPRWYAMLMIIRENPGLTQAELGRASGRDKSSITPALRHLTQRSLVKRRPMSHDGRALTLWLTPKGEALLRQLSRHAREHDRMLEKSIGLANRDALLDLLRRMMRASLSYS
jgi:DNA-binding MarR family transcriptional regulator